MISETKSCHLVEAIRKLLNHSSRYYDVSSLIELPIRLCIIQEIFCSDNRYPYQKQSVAVVYIRYRKCPIGGVASGIECIEIEWLHGEFLAPVISFFSIIASFFQHKPHFAPLGVVHSRCVVLLDIGKSHITRMFINT